MTLHRGRLLNTAHLVGPCKCGGQGPLDVFENVARSRCCGRELELRPLPALPNKPYRTKKGERRTR